MTLEYLESLVVAIGLGAFSGYIIGYAIRKVLKIVFVVLGIFIAEFRIYSYREYLTSNGIEYNRSQHRR